jgi:hypothetical protein
MAKRLTAVIARIRTVCRALPEVTERLSHGAPTWFVRDRKSFATLWADGHHELEFPHVWLAAPPGAQSAAVAESPGLFFVPPYVGGRGWIGIRLDRLDDLAVLAECCEEAYRSVAPARLLGVLDGR